jgi:FkbM family methyltransferase
MLEWLRWYLRAVKYKRRQEPHEVRFLLKHLQEGDIAVDIGAYKGAFTYWMRKKVGRTGQVFAFEPQPSLAKYLQHVTRRQPNIHVENLAISNEESPKDLFVPLAPGRSVSQLATLRETWESIPADESLTRLTVDATTLDSYFSRSTRRPVRFIKCDAEGHELNVFQGGQRLLSEDKPVLLFECETREPQQVELAIRVFDFLGNLGYRGVFFDRVQNVTRPIRTDGVVDPAYSHNFAFLPEGRVP